MSADPPGLPATAPTADMPADLILAGAGSGWVGLITDEWRRGEAVLYEARAALGALLREALEKSTGHALRVGHMLLEAKAELPHGQFVAMCKRDLPFTYNTAARLMAVARDGHISDVALAQYLPSSWATLYELTKLKLTMPNSRKRSRRAASGPP